METGVYFLYIVSRMIYHITITRGAALQQVQVAPSTKSRQRALRPNFGKKVWPSSIPLEKHVAKPAFLRMRKFVDRILGRYAPPLPQGPQIYSNYLNFSLVLIVVLGWHSKVVQAGTPSNRFSHSLGQKKIFKKITLSLGVAPAFSIWYRSQKIFFLLFRFFLIQKNQNKSLIPTVYNIWVKDFRKCAKNIKISYFYI